MNRLYIFRHMLTSEYAITIRARNFQNSAYSLH